MKKLAIVLALVFVAAFAVPAMAEVSIGGSYRLTATSYDPGFNAPVNTDNSDYFQHRLRIPITWTVNDNIKGYLRADWTEQNWFGYDTDPIVQRDKELEIDYAWVSVTQGMFNMKAGLITTGYGLYTLYESYHEGLEFNFDLSPVKVSLSYGKLAENGSTTDENETDDSDAYAINVEYATDAFTGGLIYGRVENNANNEYLGAAQTMWETTAYGFGAYVTVPVGTFSLAAEVDMFGGDAGNNIDYEGLQFMVDFSGAVSETITVGLELIYAQGTDDPTEQQLNNVATDWSVHVADFMGALAYDEGWWAGSVGIFELAPNAGSMGIFVRGSFAATEALTLHLKLGYAEVEEDSVTALDSKTFLIGSVDYAWMPNVTLSLGAGYVSPDFDNVAINDDASLDIVARLGVNF